VIDQDGDCNTEDAVAMHTPEEEFTDEMHGISVFIDSATDTGSAVTINYGFTVMESGEIDGAEEGYIEDSIPFTATVSPSDATTPIKYTWKASGLPIVVHVGDTEDRIQLSWNEVGSKAITLTATNARGTMVDTHLVEIGYKIPIVSLSGP
jgi:hypothetical protein